MNDVAIMIAQQRLRQRPIAPLAGRETGTAAFGYKLQAAVNKELEAELGPTGGSKIGASNPELMRYLRIDEPLVGEIFASSIHQSPAELSFKNFQKPGIETEIGVTLGRDVPPGGQWRTALSSMHATIEIVDNRYSDMANAGAITFLADNVFNAASIAGSAIEDFCKLDLANLHASTIIDGRVVAKGSSGVLMGGPMQALDWLFAHWRRHGRVAKAGWFISLGTMTMVQWIDKPANIKIEVEGLGSVDCRLL